MPSMIATKEPVSEHVSAIVRKINSAWSPEAPFVRAEAETVARVVRVFTRERETFLEGWNRRSDVSARIRGIGRDIWESEFGAVLIAFGVNDAEELLDHLTAPRGWDSV